MPCLNRIWILFTFFLALGLNHCSRQTEDSVQLKLPIYQPDADARADIQAAIEKARAEQKNILLMFGANWCPWCHRLHALFQQNELVKKELAQNFVLVMIDLGRRDKNMDLDSLYGKPNQLGLPALVVLDQTGKSLALQETGQFELPKAAGRGHDPEKVLAFLRKWPTTRPE